MKQKRYVCLTSEKLDPEIFLRGPHELHNIIIHECLLSPTLAPSL